MPSLPLSSTDLNFSLIVPVSWPFPGASGRVLPSDRMYSIQFSSLSVADLFFLPSFPLLHSFLTSYFCFVSLISLLTLFSIFLCIYTHIYIYIFILLLKNTYPPVAVILLQITYAIRCCCFSIVALLLRDPEFGRELVFPRDYQTVTSPERAKGQASAPDMLDELLEGGERGKGPSARAPHCCTSPLTTPPLGKSAAQGLTLTSWTRWQ